MRWKQVLGQQSVSSWVSPTARRSTIEGAHLLGGVGGAAGGAR